MKPTSLRKGKSAVSNFGERLFNKKKWGLPRPAPRSEKKREYWHWNFEKRNALCQLTEKGNGGGGGRELPGQEVKKEKKRFFLLSISRPHKKKRNSQKGRERGGGRKAPKRSDGSGPTKIWQTRIAERSKGGESTSCSHREGRFVLLKEGKESCAQAAKKRLPKRRGKIYPGGPEKKIDRVLITE